MAAKEFILCASIMYEGNIVSAHRHKPDSGEEFSTKALYKLYLKRK